MEQNVVFTTKGAIVCYDLNSLTYRIYYESGKRETKCEARQFENRREFLQEVRSVLKIKFLRADVRLHERFLAGNTDSSWNNDRNGVIKSRVDVNVRSSFIDKK